METMPGDLNEQLAAELTQALLDASGVLSGHAAAVYPNAGVILRREARDIASVAVEYAGEGKLDGLRRFIAELGDSPRAKTELQGDPMLLYDLWDTWLHHDRSILADSAKLDTLQMHRGMRILEHVDNARDSQGRERHGPPPSGEELRAGAFREAIESQVRDAVFVMRRKGYNTFESGFRDQHDGSQYIGIVKGSTRGELYVSRELADRLATMGVEVSVDTTKRDRDSVFMVPTRTLLPDEWKAIWDAFAAGMPAIGGDADNIAFRQARDFRERHGGGAKGPEIDNS